MEEFSKQEIAPKFGPIDESRISKILERQNASSPVVCLEKTAFSAAKK